MLHNEQEKFLSCNHGFVIEVNKFGSGLYCPRYNTDICVISEERPVAKRGPRSAYAVSAPRGSQPLNHAPQLVRWINNMLKSRRAQASLCGVTREVKTQRGCPQ
ncbi:hypothetical protein J6590_084406 [Homalodisca vitripennis]|nr:hypothetical protein J6590_084406 [Homalodisca vitripennis]